MALYGPSLVSPILYISHPKGYWSVSSQALLRSASVDATVTRSTRSIDARSNTTPKDRHDRNWAFLTISRLLACSFVTCQLMRCYLSLIAEGSQAGVTLFPGLIFPKDRRIFSYLKRCPQYLKGMPTGTRLQKHGLDNSPSLTSG